MSTEQDSQEPLVSMATVSIWRRRERACAEVPPVSDNDGERVNRYSAADAATVDFAESQKAGLAAMLSLAKSDVLPPPFPEVLSDAAQPEPLASGLDSATAPAPARPEPVNAQLSRIDQPEFSILPATLAPDRIPTETQGRTERRAARRGKVLASVPAWWLLVILTVQAAMSLRLVWSDTAEQDEALYTWAGRLEWAHWLHGTPIPPFATFFSGAPVVYAPLGGLADILGGLAGARILSLCFMLGATSLLWATAGRLCGKRAGCIAAGIWSVLGPTLYLGAYATYDAMSLFLIAVAAWCVVRAGTQRDVAKWLLAASAALVLANAAKYASAIFDPVVIALAVLVAYPKPGGKYAMMRGKALITYTVGALVLLLTIGGGDYYTGMVQTTVSRDGVGNTVQSVLSESWSLIGILMVVAVIGLIAGVVSSSFRQQKLTIVLLCAAGLLAPADQARLHTLTSLNKHVDFGAWFAAIAAAYAVEAVITLTHWRSVQLVTCAMCAGALIIPAKVGLTQAREIYSWPNSTQFINTFRPIVRASSGPILVETPYVAESVLAFGSQWERWSNTRSIRLPSGHSISVPVAAQGNPNTYARFIRMHYFKIVALNFRATPALDTELASDLADNHDYHIVASAPYGYGRYIIWQYIAPAGGQ